MSPFEFFLDDKVFISYLQRKCFYGNALSKLFFNKIFWSWIYFVKMFLTSFPSCRFFQCMGSGKFMCSCLRCLCKSHCFLPNMDQCKIHLAHKSYVKQSMRKQFLIHSLVLNQLYEWEISSTFWSAKCTFCWVTTGSKYIIKNKFIII